MYVHGTSNQNLYPIYSSFASAQVDESLFDLSLLQQAQFVDESVCIEDRRRPKTTKKITVNNACH